MADPPAVIVSNGFSRYNLAPAAAELARRGLLRRFITGGYPVGGWWRAACRVGLDRVTVLARLGRRGEAIPEAAIDALWGAEAVQKAGGVIARLPLLGAVGDWLDVFGYRLYGRRADRIIERFGAPGAIYHYRSGFGGPSVARARRMGMLALCEHTIAHPCLVDYLVTHRGRLPPAGAEPEPTPFWRNVRDDLARADHILVNSDFVKTTFLHQGWAPERVHVIYLGVDDRFLGMLPARRRESADRPPLRLLFAGGFEARKGAEVLAEALGGLDDRSWRLDIIGGVAPATARGLGGFLGDPRVEAPGHLPRPALAARMAAADIFVFPSLAEGSARVVFEALAAGCYVITTENAGSIVADGVHGLLVPPGDAAALRTALRRAADMGETRADIGKANSALIRSRYRQSDYGDALTRLYLSLRSPSP